MGAVSGIFNTVQVLLKNFGFTPGNSSFIVGVSGGVDSMVLLQILADKLKYDVTAAHVNYGKRGEDSEADEQMVRSYCSRKNIPLEVMDARGERMEYTSSGNFQDHAREIRRRFFLTLMDRKNADAIVLAHHRDDQIETVVQKILRGAAIENWEGMRQMDTPWVRPLLDFSKNDLVACAEEYRIPYRTDASNLSPDYARNFLRNEIFPGLERYFPGWQQNILRWSELGTIHQAMLDHVTDQVTKAESPVKTVRGTGDKPGSLAVQDDDLTVKPAGAVTGSEDSKTSILNRNRWLKLPDTLKVPVARNWIRREAGHINWSRGSVLRLSDLEVIETGGRVQVSDRLVVMRDRSRFVMVKETDLQFPVAIRISELPADSQETADSQEAAEFAGFLFKRSVYRPELIRDVLQLRWSTLAGKHVPVKEGGTESVLILRPWEKGDRIQPLGMKGSQLVSDHLTNRKISSVQKKNALVLIAGNGTIHAVLFPHTAKSGHIGTIADHTRCLNAGEPILLIEKNR